MSGKLRARNIAGNVAEVSTVSVNEQILKECHDLYSEKTNGLVKIADGLGLKLLAPRKKIVVLLIGNHSAGKSSFINWYIEEHVQKTGVAIETQGFTFVTSGKKRESLTGNATLHLYPHFKPLRNMRGVVDYLTTEVSTSRQKKFSLVTFVDTPGLVDGDMNYPFDVNQTISWLGEIADLIFVFFDPIGQALCKRTLNIVEKLHERHSDRVRFYLSKADEAGHESDRQRVMMQIVQELCKRPSLNKTCFDMPTIYIPNQNKIEEVCKEIEKTIKQTVQNTLNAVERDCKKIVQTIECKLTEDKIACRYNTRECGKSVVFAALGVPVLVMLLANLFVGSVSNELLVKVIGEDWTQTIRLYLSPVRLICSAIPVESRPVAFFLVTLLLMLLLISRFPARLFTLSRKQRKSLIENCEHVQRVVKHKKEVLYETYLRQSIGEQDLL